MDFFTFSFLFDRFPIHIALLFNLRRSLKSSKNLMEGCIYLPSCAQGTPLKYSAKQKCSALCMYITYAQTSQCKRECKTINRCLPFKLHMSCTCTTLTKNTIYLWRVWKDSSMFSCRRRRKTNSSKFSTLYMKTIK